MLICMGIVWAWVAAAVVTVALWGMYKLGYSVGEESEIKTEVAEEVRQYLRERKAAESVSGRTESEGKP